MSVDVLEDCTERYILKNDFQGLNYPIYFDKILNRIYQLKGIFAFNQTGFQLSSSLQIFEIFWVTFTLQV